MIRCHYCRLGGGRCMCDNEVCAVCAEPLDDDGCYTCRLIDSAHARAGDYSRPKSEELDAEIERRVQQYAAQQRAREWNGGIYGAVAPAVDGSGPVYATAVKRTHRQRRRVPAADLFAGCGEAE